MPPHETRGEIERLTERYGIIEWRVEKNACQASTMQDQEVRTYLAGRGCLISGHHTNSSKWDSDFGVASMAPSSKGGGTAAS